MDTNENSNVNHTEPTPEGGKSEPTFTQAQVNALISERLERERAKYPTKEELDGFKKWQSEQQSEAERAAEREKKITEITAELELAKRENLIIKAGVPAEDTDYILFKVGKMEGTFKDNLETFLKENPRFTAEPTVNLQGGKHAPAVGQTSDGVEEAFYRRNPQLKPK